MEPLTVAIAGAGGVGGYFGGLLAAAGHKVAFLSRGEHLRALQERGLQIKSIHGDFVVDGALTTDDPSEIGEVEYVVVSVKHYQLPQMAPRLHSLIGPQTTVVPLLNGIDAGGMLSDALGPGSIVGGLCSVISWIESPGVIRQTSQLRQIVVGELNRTKSERVHRIVEAWRELGVQAIESENILSALWTKLAFIAAFGGLTSLTRTNIGEILNSKESRELFVEAMREVEEVATSSGVHLEEDVIRRGISMAENLESTATSSMQRDVAAGKAFELEAFSGTVVRRGRDLSVNTPIHRMIYGLLKPALSKVLQEQT